MRTPVSRLAALLVALSLVAVGCGASTPSGSVATVDGHEIPWSVVAEAVAELERVDVVGLSDMDSDMRATTIRAIEQQVLSLHIQAKILENLAEERGLEVDVESVREEMDAQIAEIGEDQAAEMLAGSNLTVTLFRDVLMPLQMRMEALQEELLADAPPVELRSARHILVETEDEADALVAELADGADFAELAGEHSTDGSAQRGGDLGAQPRGSYVEPFEVAVWDAEIGVVVGPVESMYGFHIIEVTDESTAPASDLSNEQADQLIGQEFASILADAFNDADVEVAPELGVWDPQAVAVVDGEQVGSTDQP